jgi:flagellar hook-associated protein 2
MSTTTSAASASTSPTYFTGVSSYSSDLQQVITRAVSIASMPLTLMQDQLQNLDNQQSALSGLNSTFSALQSAIAGIGTALGPSSYSATSSSGAVSASVTSGALEGSYAVDVTDLGSYSTSVSDPSLPAVTDPTSSSISTSSTYTLTVNGTTTTITPAGNSLMDLAQAINTASAGVQASVVNTGSSYSLVVRSANLAGDSIQLNDGSQDLLDTLTTGSPAVYDISGLGDATQPIDSNSRTVTLAPGVTINLLQQTAAGQPATVTVSRDTSGASSAISSFVDAYNAAVDALNQQVGQSGGALSGESTISDLRNSLRQITQYAGTSGGVTLLSQMGITMDDTGELTFDASQFSSVSASDLDQFLGSATGGGFLQTATNAMNAVEDPTTGFIPTATNDVNGEITQENNLITAEQQKIATLQSTLTQQMATADATIASLEQQKDYITNLFTAMINQNDNGTGVSSN